MARRGYVVVLAIVTMSIACMVIADQARLLALRRQELRLQRHEARVWLIEQAALERARLKHQLDLSYTGEIWLADAVDDEGSGTWEVFIKRDPERLEPVSWQVSVQKREAESPAIDLPMNR